ncbi:MAG: hypothetical protein QXL34_02250 [Thermosphaera sp.]
MSQSKHFKKEYEKLLILPVSKREIEASLLNLGALFEFLRIPKTSGEINNVEISWVYKPSIVSSKKISMKIDARKVGEDTIIIEGLSEDLDFTMTVKILEIFYAVHTNIKIECKGSTRDVCDKFFIPILDSLRDYIVKAPKPTPVEKTLSSSEKPQRLPSPKIEGKQAVAETPKESLQTQEVKIDVQKLYDEFSLAMLLLKSDLIASTSLKPVWSVHSIREIIESNLAKMRAYNLAILTLKSLDGKIDMYLFVTPQGVITGFKGRIEGVEYRGNGKDLEKIVVLMYDAEMQVRLWGVKEPV